MEGLTDLRDTLYNNGIQGGEAPWHEDWREKCLSASSLGYARAVLIVPFNTPANVAIERFAEAKDQGIRVDFVSFTRNECGEYDSVPRDVTRYGFMYSWAFHRPGNTTYYYESRNHSWCMGVEPTVLFGNGVTIKDEEGYV